MSNFNKVPFQFKFSGSCKIRRNDKSSTSRIYEIETQQLSNFVAYQGWKENVTLANNSPRRVVAIDPFTYTSIISKYNSNNPNNEYHPSCLIKIGDMTHVMVIDSISIKLIQTQKEKIGLGFSNKNVLLFTVNNNFTNIGKSKDGQRVDPLPMSEEYINVDIHFSGLPYNELEYYGDNRGNTVFGEDGIFTSLLGKPENDIMSKHHGANYDSMLLNVFHGIPKPKRQLLRNFNYLIKDKGSVYPLTNIFFKIIIKNPKMVTAYEDWTTSTIQQNTSRRVLKHITIAELVLAISKHNHGIASHLEKNDLQNLFKFNPTAFIEINNKPFICVVDDIQIKHHDNFDDDFLHITMHTKSVKRINNTYLQSPTDVEKDASVFINIDSLPPVPVDSTDSITSITTSREVDQCLQALHL